MGVLQRFEKRLENLVEGAFAKVFKGVVHPVEIASAMQREADAHKSILGPGRTLVPNRYVIDLSPADHDRLAQYAAPLAQELAQAQAEYIGEQGWTVYGDIIVEIERGTGLDTGMFRIVAEVYTGSVDAAPQPTGPSTEYGRQGYDQAAYGGPPASGPPAGYGQGGYGDPRQPSAPPYGQQDQYGQPDPYRQPDPYAKQDQYGQPESYQQAEQYRPPDPYGAPPGPYGAPGAPGGYGAPPGPDPGQYAPPPFSGPPAQPVSGAPGNPYAPVSSSPTPPVQPLHSARQARLDSNDGRQFAVAIGSTTIGRGEVAQVRIADAGISRQHARLDYDGSRVVVTDLGSTNGTSVNGNRITSAALRPGDVIQLGTTTLTFRMDG